MASLMEAVEVQTAQGGMAVSYDPLGSVWLKLGARRRRERTENGITRAVETLAAVVRADPRLEAGLVLRFGGADWDLMALEPEGVGRLKLGLERRR